MKTKIIYLLLLLFIGCKKESQPTQPSNSLTGDELLKSKIVGQWKAGSNWNYTFTSDSTFVDSFFTPSPKSIDTVKYIVAYVARGKFSIQNAIMTFPQMELVYADTSLLFPFFYMTYYIYYPHKIEFKNEDLVMNLIDVLSPVNSDGKNINGTWETENWIAQIERRPTNTALFGKIKKEYNFNTDSSKYTYHLTNSFNSPYQVQNDSGVFSYSATYYSFGTFSGKPEFIDGKLILNYGMWPIFIYSKVK